MGVGGVVGYGGLIVYPKPMFDFPTQRDKCLAGMKNAYHVGLYGNDPKVLDGTWRTLFDDKAEGPTEGSNGPPGAMVEHEDVDGHEEHHADEAPSPKRAKKMAAKSDKKAAGHKREASQGTLDGMFTRKKKKEEDVFPNETHFG
jgi:cryptochrome